MPAKSNPDPQRDLKIRSPRTKVYKDYIGVVMGLYRGYNFWILPGVWEVRSGILATPAFFRRNLTLREWSGCSFRVEGSRFGNTDTGLRGFLVQAEGS